MQVYSSVQNTDLVPNKMDEKVLLPLIDLISGLISIPEHLLQEHQSNWGVSQGELDSPCLFCLFINAVIVSCISECQFWHVLKRTC